MGQTHEAITENLAGFNAQQVRQWVCQRGVGTRQEILARYGLTAHG
jgi:hypothetical protein